MSTHPIFGNNNRSRYRHHPSPTRFYCGYSQEQKLLKNRCTSKDTKSGDPGDAAQPARSSTGWRTSFAGGLVGLSLFREALLVFASSGSLLLPGSWGCEMDSLHC